MRILFIGGIADGATLDVILDGRDIYRVQGFVKGVENTTAYKLKRITGESQDYFIMVEERNNKKDPVKVLMEKCSKQKKDTLIIQGNSEMQLPVDYTKLNQRKRAKVRNEYVRRQEGKCWFCKKPLDEPANRDEYIDKKYFPANFFGNPVHLHHDHDNGMTIGAVHCECNAVLWLYHGE